MRHDNAFPACLYGRAMRAVTGFGAGPHGW